MSTKHHPREIAFEEGSGNVFADLGFDNAEERFAHARLGACVTQILTESGRSPSEIGSLLQLAPSEVEHLLDGHFSRFSTDALLAFLKRLDRKVTIRITPHHPGEPYHDIALGP
ncbi:helix-turn-helix domain-containing protein [Tautonia rosea]|uniref:helix-turn-helix domain-containing protein n=1 Tax=Tautonia rosea TaxID=2728037 RepID=UPI0014739A45|nr:helix-turn-helix transcriptional regulator [Tautonia rosea]